MASVAWIPDPNGGTIWDEADEPDPNWYNPVYVRVWIPTGNRIWTAASGADPDWVNAEYEQRWM